MLKLLFTLLSFCMILPLFGQISCMYNTIVYPTGNTFECSNYEWELVLDDDFDGSSLDLNLWEPEYTNPAPADQVLFPGGTHEGARMLPENIEVSGGTLKIITKNEQSTYIGEFEDNFNDAPELIGNIGESFSYDFILHPE